MMQTLVSISEWSDAMAVNHTVHHLVGTNQPQLVWKSACRVTCHLTYLPWIILVSQVRFTLRLLELRKWRCFIRIKSLLGEMPMSSAILFSRCIAEFTYIMCWCLEDVTYTSRLSAIYTVLRNKVLQLFFNTSWTNSIKLSMNVHNWIGQLMTIWFWHNWVNVLCAVA